MTRTLKRALSLFLVLALSIPSIAFAEEMPGKGILENDAAYEIEAELPGLEDIETLLPEVESAAVDAPVAETEAEMGDPDAEEVPGTPDEPAAEAEPVLLDAIDADNGLEVEGGTVGL